MSWTEEKVKKLRELWGSGKTASQIAEIIGGLSRNAIIGKAHRLNLSAKIKTRSSSINQNNIKSNDQGNGPQKKVRRSKFKSIVIEKDFPAEDPKQLLELEHGMHCKFPIGHPNETNFYFCGRKPLKDFSYCKLHLLYCYQSRDKKENIIEKDTEKLPNFITKKIKSA